MEETKKLTIPKGYEFDRVEGGEVILKKKEVALPKTWEECLCVVDDVEMIDEISDVREYNIADEMQANHEISMFDYGLIPSGLGKPMLALCQLLVCRNAWWKQLRWKPDWKDKCDKFCIATGEGRVKATVYCVSNAILAFPTAEVRGQFYEAFRDLIEEAKELL